MGAYYTMIQEQYGPSCYTSVTTFTYEFIRYSRYFDTGFEGTWPRRFEILGLLFNTVSVGAECYAHLLRSKQTGWYNEFFTVEGREEDVKIYEEANDDVPVEFEEGEGEEEFQLDIAWLNAILDFLQNYYVRLALQIFSSVTGFQEFYTQMKAETYYFFFSGMGFGQILVSTVQGLNQVVNFYDYTGVPQHVRFSKRYQDEIREEVEEFRHNEEGDDLVDDSDVIFAI